jgi:hypothetical protein
MDICKVLNREKPKHSQRVGIEVELEKISLLTYAEEDIVFWELTTDGSLRGGLELISKPLSLNTLPIALREFKDIISLSSRVNVNPRTSMHIHIDCSSLTLEQLKQFVMVSLIFEEVLIYLQPECRRNNTFCLSSRQCYEQVRVIGSILNCKDEESLLKLSNKLRDSSRSYKYSAINYDNLFTIGTIEFRMFQASTDPAFIRKWANFLLDLQKKAIRGPSVDDLIALKEAYGIMSVFGGVINTYLQGIERDTLEELLERGLEMANDAVFLYK